MLTFLQRDLKEEAKIAKRRQNEAERKKRIFDVKERLFGVDVKSLEQQSFERKNQQEQEKKQNEDYHSRKIEEDKLCVAIDSDIRKKKMHIEKEIQNYRDNYQRLADRREYDLNGPQYIKNAAYTSHGVVRFDGEDNNHKERLRQQQIETRAWLLQQMEEKKRSDEEARNRERIFQETLRAQSQQSKQLNELDEKIRKQIDETTLRFNMMTAEERETHRRLERTHETEINKKEIQNWMTGDFLTENPAVATSAFGPHRKIPYMYKGELRHKSAETKKLQLDQAKEKTISKENDQADQLKWDSYLYSVDQTANAIDNNYTARKREIEKDLLRANSHLAEDHKVREAERKEASRQTPTVRFYDQFNRTSY